MSQSITQLTPNLWVAQSTRFSVNSGIFLDAGRACLIDPGMLPIEIEAIANFVAEQDAIPQVMILTHSHWDHLLGAEYFPGIKTVAHANYLTEVSGEYGSLILPNVERWDAYYDIEREQPFVVPQPDKVFEEKLSLTVGSLLLNLIHVPGHQADQLAVYQPDGGTLWAGDMLSDSEIPTICYNLAAYEATMEMLSALDIRVLIPGHGHPTLDAVEIRTRIDNDIAYLGALRDKVEPAVRKGKTLDETAEMCAGIQYHDPEENGGIHQLNIETVFLELGGDADPSKVGWRKSEW